jgi:HK97 family phage major capsid protein
MMAAVFGHDKSMQWCQDNGIVLQKAQSEGVNAQGGVFVPEEFSTEIIDLRDQYGIFRRLCRVIPMGRDTMTQPRRVGGLTAYAVGEAQAITQSTTAWDNIRLTANKWGVLTLMSTELDEDAAVAVGDLLVGEVAYAFAVAEDTAGFSGDGSATYHGIRGFLQLMGADQVSGGASTLAGCVDAASGHDTFAEIDATDLANLMAKLPQYAYMRGNVGFYCSQYAWGATFQRIIQGAGGISKDDITGRIIYRYLGFPVEITPAMPAVGTDLSDKVMLLFGDIGMAATMGDRRGMTVARSTEYKFAEDQIAIKGTERFDINIHDIGSTTVPGPVVALIGE